MNATLSISNVFKNRGLRRLDHEGAESSVDFSTMLQWTVNTIGAWEMPLGHDLILPAFSSIKQYPTSVF